MADSPLPSGIVTFIFTDIEGSTRLWERDPDAMRVAIGDQTRIVGSLNNLANVAHQQGD